MRLGFMRLSPLEPPADLAAQKRALAAAGCEKTFHAEVLPRGPHTERDRMLALAREGDCVVVARGDRIARSASQLVLLADKLIQRGIGLVVLAAPAIDTRNAAANHAAMTVLRSVAAMEKAVRREYQNVGIRRAVAAGQYKGRKPKISTAMVLDMAKELRPARIAKLLHCSRSAVYAHLPQGYRVTPRPPKPANGHRAQPIDAATVRVLSRTLGPSAVAKALDISTSSVRRLRSEGDRDWR